VNELEQILTLTNNGAVRGNVGSLTVILNGTNFDMDKFPERTMTNGSVNG